jgi:hypothetical protein
MRSRRVWLAVLIGPLAWLAYLQTAYALVPSACQRPPGGTMVLLAGVTALALSTAGLVAAWQAWHRPGGVREDAGYVTGGVRAIALAGVAATALLVLIVIGGMLPLLLLAPCR